MLGGGLPLAALHEIRVAESREGGMAAGFVLSLVALIAAERGIPRVIWISEADVRGETGRLHAPGLMSFGLHPGAIVEVVTRTEEEALWAFEAALVCRGLGIAVCELRQASLDLSVTRRCALRARATGVTGFLLRLGSEAEPSAAELRFRLSTLPAGTIGGFSAGIGRMAWRLTLEKNRTGPTGALMVEWDAYERSFVEREEGLRAHSQPVPAASRDQSPHPAGAEREGSLPTQRGLRFAS
jgi:protein ImuA